MPRSQSPTTRHTHNHIAEESKATLDVIATANTENEIESRPPREARQYAY